jgi:SagB-type dehydrogenase family enzyme
MAKPNAAASYHQQTKYHPTTVGQGHHIDWNNPPPQFKEYPGAERFDMRPFLPIQDVEPWQAEAGLNDPDGLFGLPALSRLLIATNGVTAIGEGGGIRAYFRSAPSAGALYPTDLYVLTRNHADIPDGVYYFHVREHALIEVYPKGLGPSGDDLFKRLSAACFDDPLVASADMALVATAVYWRSAWRYGERAYRRCLLDSGHVLGNFDIVAPRQGIAPFAVGGFVDDKVTDLLAIPPEKEGVLGVFPLHDIREFDRLSPGPSARASLSEPAIGDQPDAILRVHNAGAITRADMDAIRKRTHDPADSTELGEDGLLPNPKYEFAKGIKLKPGGEDMTEQVELAILRRRSTRRLSGEPLTLTELSDMLAFAYRPDLTITPAALPRYFDRSLLETFVVVNRVEGLEPGVYYFAPGFMELLKVHSGEVRREIYHLCLGQELARDASAVVVHTADLEAATNIYGSRAYRYLHLDAGHLGQRLNVAASRLELGVSGIGGFFDDEVNELLDIPEKELCVYITCLGRPAG